MSRLHQPQKSRLLDGVAVVLCLSCLLALLCGCGTTPYAMYLGTERHDNLVRFSDLQVDYARYSGQFGAGRGGSGYLLDVRSPAEAELALEASLEELSYTIANRSCDAAGWTAFLLTAPDHPSAYVSLQEDAEGVFCRLSWQRLQIAGRDDRVDLFAELLVPRHLLAGEPDRLNWKDRLALQPLLCRDSSGTVDALETQQEFMDAFTAFYETCSDYSIKTDGDTLRLTCPADGVALLWIFSTGGNRAYVQVQLEQLS